MLENNSIDNSFNSYYYELVQSSNKLFSKVPHKDFQEWLKSEVITKYIDNYEGYINFSKDFKVIYNKTCLKFDLIDDFLNTQRKINVELSEELYKMFQFYIEKKDIYTSFKIIASLIFYVKKDSFLLKLIDESLPYFKEVHQYDYTILLTIIGYVKSEYDLNSLEEIRKKSNYF